MHPLFNRDSGAGTGGALGLVVAVLLSACMSTPQPPTAALTEAREAIASAEQEDARQHAEAELDEAKQKLAEAERSVNNEQMIEAERLAREAEMAAELAIARTESRKAAAINREMEQGADALQEELRRSGDQQ